MATAGFVWITEQVGSAAWFRRTVNRILALHPPLTTRHIATVAPALVTGFALLATTKGLYEGRDALVIHEVHKTPPERAAKLAFYRQVQHKVPPDAVIANNPEDGSPLLWAVEQRHVLLPHLTANHSPNRAYLSQRLTHAATDPHACQIARTLHVGYLVTDLTLPDGRRREYPGFQDYPGMRGFELVLTNGTMKLFRLTACRTAGPLLSAPRSTP